MLVSILNTSVFLSNLLKKRLHDKKASIAILISIIVISLADYLYRVLVIKDSVYTTANLGEQLAVIALATTTLILSAKGKDRACFILLGAWQVILCLTNL